MCGIAGAVLARAGSPGLQRIQSTSECLQHRGPDDSGYLQYGNGELTIAGEWMPRGDTRVAFAHRRLAILDLSHLGFQPMQTPDGAYAIAFNGEIYNFIELRSELEALGARFCSNSDTEVVLAAYRQWGADAFSRFTGMFALAILDRRRDEVIVARDPFGIKPLYYAVNGDGFFFASELPALLELSGAPRRIDAERLYRFLRYGVTDDGDGTLLADVRQLPAAHFARIPLSAATPLEPRAYWKLDCTRREISFKEAAQVLREKFLKSVSLHLRSDVPLGTALSGGIDSSSIVAAIRLLQPGAEIHAFSYIAAGTPLDEERWIDIAARASSAQTHKVYPDAGGFQSDLAALNAAQGEPFASTSIYAQYRVFARAAQEGIKVMLDGQGADEMLGGYRQYLGARLAGLMRAGKLPAALRFALKASQMPGTSSAYLVQKAAEHLIPDAWQQPLRRLAGRETMPPWLNGAWFEREGVMARGLIVNGERQLLKAQLVLDVRATSLPSLLRYEDRNSMASSIESRVPFLTTDLVEFVFSLPEEHFIASDGTTKAVFRQAMRGIVPDAILDRRDKIGFATPERDWLRSIDAWVRPLLDGEAAYAIPAMRPPAVKAAWEETLSGKRRFDYQMWRLFNIIFWSRQFDVRYA